MSEFDPLAQNAQDLMRIHESAVPPDARGADDEITSLEGLERSRVKVVQHIEEPVRPPTIIVAGGDQRHRRKGEPR